MFKALSICSYGVRFISLGKFPGGVMNGSRMFKEPLILNLAYHLNTEGKKAI